MWFVVMFLSFPIDVQIVYQLASPQYHFFSFGCLARPENFWAVCQKMTIFLVQWSTTCCSKLPMWCMTTMPSLAHRYPPFWNLAWPTTREFLRGTLEMDNIFVKVPQSYPILAPKVIHSHYTEFRARITTFHFNLTVYQRIFGGRTGEWR